MSLWRVCWWFGQFIGLIDGMDKLISLNKILAGLIKIFFSEGLFLCGTVSKACFKLNTRIISEWKPHAQFN